MTEWVKRHRWQTFVLIWASGIVLVLLVQVLLTHGTGKRIDWPEAVTFALIIPSIGSFGTAEALRDKAGGLVATSSRS